DPSLPRPDSHTVWTAMIRLPNHGEVVIWAEPMRPLPAKTVEALKIDGVKWLVGIETVLDPADPLKRFCGLLKTMARAFPRSPAILNVNTECWHTREEMDQCL